MRKCAIWMLATLLLLALAGCGASAVGVASGTPASPSATATAMPTLAPTNIPGPTPTPASLASLGWKQSTAPQPDAIAVAPSAPGTIYTCTGIAGGSVANVISFSVSTDGGSTWRTSNTPAKASVCNLLRVSPTVPQAVAFYASTCRGDCGSGENTLYYSLDAGAHWTSALTSSNGGGSLFAWVSTTLFVNGAPASVPSSKTPYLAASTNGGAFAWTTLPVAPQALFSGGSTLYALGTSSTSCSSPAPVACADLYTSTNLGQSWAHSIPAYQNNRIILAVVAPGGTMLIGYDARMLSSSGAYPLLRSTTSGASWQPLPAFSADSQPATDPLVAPDGAVYVELFSNTASQTSGVYKLTPGASHWVLVSPVEAAQVHLVALSWDAGGHPLTLWGFADSPTGNTLSTLWTHPA